MRRISLIVAMDRNRVIGRDGGLPWRLSADLQRFKRLTMGHAIIMGRKTYESIGRPLPGRTSIVISRQPSYQPDGVIVANSLEAALAAANSDDEVFIVGGSHVFQDSLPLAHRLYITLVQAEVTGDTYFPEYDREQWTLVESTAHPADAKNEYPYEFQVYDRRDDRGR